MTNLTTNELEVLTALQSIHGEDEIDGMKMVYLDNGIDTQNKSVRATLGSLEKKGLYEKEDGFAWGWVKA